MDSWPPACAVHSASLKDRLHVVNQVGEGVLSKAWGVFLLVLCTPRDRVQHRPHPPRVRPGSLPQCGGYPRLCRLESCRPEKKRREQIYIGQLWTCAPEVLISARRRNVSLRPRRQAGAIVYQKMPPANTPSVRSHTYMYGFLPCCY
jgi:hypothetical protein